jgi:hypothetical protein
MPVFAGLFYIVFHDDILNRQRSTSKLNSGQGTLKKAEGYMNKRVATLLCVAVFLSFIGACILGLGPFVIITDDPTKLTALVNHSSWAQTPPFLVILLALVWYMLTGGRQLKNYNETKQ